MTKFIEFKSDHGRTFINIDDISSFYRGHSDKNETVICMRDSSYYFVVKSSLEEVEKLINYDIKLKEFAESPISVQHLKRVFGDPSNE